LYLITEGKDTLLGEGDIKGKGILLQKLGLILILSTLVLFSPTSTEDHYEFRVLTLGHIEMIQHNLIQRAVSRE